uniref:Mitochondrial glutamate carrier 1-like n=1 Tax=Rhabditophanes sp. KR3021 TaxID=114890 RepID=A0AC35UGE8_9BILA
MSQKEFSYRKKILSGGTAGIVGVTCVFPLDLVKTRLQNQIISGDGKAQYSSILDCAKKVWNSGGISYSSKFRGLYSGYGVNVLLITPEKAIKLVANDVFRYKLAAHGETKLALWKAMVAGGSAGALQCIVTSPMEFFKIQGQTGTKVSVPELALKIFKEKGIAGLYKGIVPTLCRDISFSVLYFPLFAILDDLAPRKNNGSESVFWGSLLAGLSAGAFSSFAVTPLDVVKTRMQMITPEKKYKHVPDALVKILNEEGPKALFKGGAMRSACVGILFGVAQTIYAISSHLF